MGELEKLKGLIGQHDVRLSFIEKQSDKDSLDFWLGEQTAVVCTAEATNREDQQHEETFNVPQGDRVGLESSSELVMVVT